MNENTNNDHEKSVTEGPDEFLKKLREKMLKQEKVDADLAEILAIHLLTTTPENDAVARAKTDILKLASDRATPPKSELPHG